MTRLSTAGLLLLAVAIAIPVAAETHSETITLYHDAALNGTNIPAGEYTVKYDLQGAAATVKVLRGNKVVATAPGQVIALQSKPDRNQVVLNGDGSSRSIAEIDFRGKNSAISFDNSMSAGGK